jgi:hypothetical protein
MAEVEDQCKSRYSFIIGFAASGTSPDSYIPDDTTVGDCTQKPVLGTDLNPATGWVTSVPDGIPANFRDDNGVCEGGGTVLQDPLPNFGALRHPDTDIPNFQQQRYAAERFNDIEIKYDRGAGHTLQDGVCEPHEEPCSGWAEMLFQIQNGSLDTGGGAELNGCENSPGPVNLITGSYACQGGGETVSKPPANSNVTLVSSDDDTNTKVYKVRVEAPGCGKKRGIVLVILAADGKPIESYASNRPKLVILMEAECDPCEDEE